MQPGPRLVSGSRDRTGRRQPPSPNGAEWFSARTQVTWPTAANDSGDCPRTSSPTPSARRLHGNVLQSTPEARFRPIHSEAERITGGISNVGQAE